MNHLTDVDVRALVFGDDAEAKTQFEAVFTEEVGAAIAVLTTAFNRCQQMAPTLAVENRNATVRLFVHVALNSILSGLHLLVSGYPVPHGHLMRQFAEAQAMAMLCADPGCNVYETYDANRKTYPVHKALARVTEKRTAKSLQNFLGLNSDGYAQFVKAMGFYNRLSHPSAVVLGYSIMFTGDPALILGSQFDHSKRDQYKRELEACTRAAKAVHDLVVALDRVLPKRGADDRGTFG